ncbi:MAG: DUF1922 domain-containing protein [Thermoplasmata archaeon]
MMYGVVVCSHCGRARAVNLNQKTSTCECGRRIAIAQSRVYFRSDSQREVASAVRQMNARLSGAPALDREGTGESPEKDLGSSLSRFFGDDERSLRQLKALLSKLGIENQDRVIEELLVNGVIFEPRKGYFRLV